MPNDELLTDEYVAELLAKEAADSALKYSSMGMESSRTDKKPANMPKPNTRFLQRIIKSTNTHNANLLASEAAESQARLKQLERAEERQRRRDGAPADIRRRQMGDIKAILGGRSSSSRQGRCKTAEKSDTRDTPDSKRRRADRNTSPKHDRDERHRRDDTSDHERTSRRGTKDSRRRSRSPEARDRKHRHRSRSPRTGEDTSHRSSRTDKSRRRHREEEGSSSRRHGHYRDRSRHSEDRDSQRPRQSRSDQSEKRRHKDTEKESDSDPLEDIIGPAPPPPVRVRGRGFQGRSSGIDKRFDPDYDPKTDVDMEDSTDNWDDAVETFRDRKKYEQAQEQRMREAGFGDDDIKLWKKGGQRNEEDVRWTKAGEEREWDRGKDDEPPKGLLSFSD